MDGQLSRQRILRSYKESRGKPQTTLGLLRRHWRSYASFLTLLLLLQGLVLIGSFVADAWWGTFLMAGLIAGCICREYSWIKQAPQRWQVLEQIIDWNRVDKLLAQADEGTPHPSA